MPRKDAKYQELWCEQAMAIVDPQNSSQAKIGMICRFRLDLNLTDNWEQAGEYVTNDFVENPTTKNQEVTHVQVVPLQMLNDIIQVSNQTKLDNQTGQKLLDPVTPEQALAAAHSHKKLIRPEDDVFFVATLH